MKEARIDLINDKMFFDVLKGLNIIEQDSYSNAYLIVLLDEDDWRKNLKDIRYINPKSEFDYASYGDYFFYENKLFVITDDIDYRKFDSKKAIKDSFYKNLIDKNKYVIEAKYAGFYIEREDVYGDKIYYGDILKVSVNNFTKCKKCEYFGGPFKDREIKDIDVVYGAVSISNGWNHCSNENQQYSVWDQAFGVMPNLCMSINTVIVANVFYDVCYESKFQYLDIHKAVLSDYNVTCRFWDYYVPIEKRIGKSNNEIWEYAINKYQKNNFLKQPLKNNKSLKSIFNIVKFFQRN